VSFDGSDAGSRRRRDRGQLARNVLLGVVALGAVAGAAMMIGDGKGSPSGSGPRTGIPRPGPVPPEVIFANAKLGYAAYHFCNAQSLGHGCRSTLMRTKDAGRTWQRVALPPGTPTDSSGWHPMQVRDDLLVLSWTGGAVVSSTDGDAWKPVVLAAAGTTTEVASGMIVNVGNGALALDLTNPDKPVAIRFQPASDVDRPGAVAESLVDGGLWATNGPRLDISRSGGKSWSGGPISAAAIVRPPLLGKNGHDVRVSGPVSTIRLGISGDGGELPASDFEFTTNEGVSWAPKKISGPQVNALCTVLLKDGSLLGVSVDGTSLLRLAPDATKLEPLKQPPLVVPSCLSTGNGLVWGAGFDGKFLIGDDSPTGVAWSVGSLPPNVHYGTLI
jgi:hypothetical protein